MSLSHSFPLQFYIATLRQWKANEAAARNRGDLGRAAKDMAEIHSIENVIAAWTAQDRRCRRENAK